MPDDRRQVARGLPVQQHGDHRCGVEQGRAAAVDDRRGLGVLGAHRQPLARGELGVHDRRRPVDQPAVRGVVPGPQVELVEVLPAAPLAEVPRHVDGRGGAVGRLAQLPHRGGEPDRGERRADGREQVGRRLRVVGLRRGGRDVARRPRGEERLGGLVGPVRREDAASRHQQRQHGEEGEATDHGREYAQESSATSQSAEHALSRIYAMAYVRRCEHMGGTRRSAASGVARRAARGRPVGRPARGRAGVQPADRVEAPAGAAHGRARRRPQGRPAPHLRPAPRADRGDRRLARARTDGCGTTASTRWASTSTTTTEGPHHDRPRHLRRTRRAARRPLHAPLPAPRGTGVGGGERARGASALVPLAGGAGAARGRSHRLPRRPQPARGDHRDGPRLRPAAAAGVHVGRRRAAPHRRAGR